MRILKFTALLTAGCGLGLLFYASHSLLTVYSVSGDVFIPQIMTKYAEASGVIEAEISMDIRDVDLEKLSDVYFRRAQAKALRYTRQAREMSQTSTGGVGTVSTVDGKADDHGDSLLFSSLSVYGQMLLARGPAGDPGVDATLRKNARAANIALISGLRGPDGYLVRHPRCCGGAAVSRDGVMGLALVALANDTETVLRPFAAEGRVSAESIRGALLDSITMGAGLFVSPLWRNRLQGSLVNPTILAMVFPRSPLPFFLANDMRLVTPEPRGFVSHLSALTLQFELEAERAHIQPHTVVSNIFHDAFSTASDREDQTVARRLMLGHSLVALSPENLLFDAIYAQAILLQIQSAAYHNAVAGDSIISLVPLHALRLTLASGLLVRLKGLEDKGLFPENLPSTNEGLRDQDYLWQREAGDWQRPAGAAAVAGTRVWAGVDYTLLVGIIATMLGSSW